MLEALPPPPLPQQQQRFAAQPAQAGLLGPCARGAAIICRLVITVCCTSDQLFGRVFGLAKQPGRGMLPFAMHWHRCLRPNLCA